ncbi:hypothetical protein FWF74_01285 [Candidatus Saccharibacteria bacterium]|nr:hypothetical protein [Candidatus Saccharibacteria bacterium]MCL1963167.1 hypothetical protein [Candidatus Saccharibacteria bacterium]
MAKKEAIIDIEEESLNVILRPYGLRDNTEYVRFALGALEDNPCVHYRAGKGGGCQIKSHMPNGGRLVIPNQPCLPGAETMFVMANRQPDFKALLFMIACEYRPGLTQQCLTGVERVYKRYKDSFDPRYFAKFLETLVGIYRLNSTDFYVTIFLCIKL